MYVNEIVNKMLLHRSRKLIHHPSLADFGPKRQIVVATKSGKEKDQVVFKLFITHTDIPSTLTFIQ